MAERPRFSIGIDLGTTNCALAYVDLDLSDAGSIALPISQRSELTRLVESATLPSYLYLPTNPERGYTADDGGFSNGWLVGQVAREQSLAQPDRVARSAKSWLCHHTVDPESKVLPWKSSAIAEDRKLSPIDASSMLLSYLKKSWDQTVGQQYKAPFEDQAVTITVPASFDVAAQRATLRAAKEAGYPAETRLLEEPQAAFYNWLELSASKAVLKEGQRILVVDIGGGTSDFSLFEAVPSGMAEGPQFERLAVGDHILLGGDNMDLALAHAVESELGAPGGELDADQWAHLIARCRELKERCLGNEYKPGEQVGVSVPSRGSGLFAGSLSARVSCDDARELLQDGFFPLCSLNERPERPAGGLLEWGLPYASDCAVTRYLAEFYGSVGGRVDAVLFNGGALMSDGIQERLLAQLAAWQDGQAPLSLSGTSMDLAVARGAARYGAIAFQGKARIAAGAARAVFLEVAASEAASPETKLLCVLPRGAQPGREYWVEIEGLQLATNRRARFQAWQGDGPGVERAGETVEKPRKGFAILPALEAEIEEKGDAGAVPIRIRSLVTELGVLQVECVSRVAGAAGTWLLEFNLRRSEAEDVLSANQDPAPIDTKRLELAAAEVKDLALASDPKASRALKRLEATLGLPRGEWTVDALRRLADSMLGQTRALDRSAAHAECWIQVVGYCLRPGFGHPSDPARSDALWLALQRPGLARPPRVEVQEAILWRRVAAGLSEDRQRTLMELHWEKARRPKGDIAERIRLLGSLERAPMDNKEKLIQWILELALRRVAEGGYPAPCFAALGQLLSRTLLRAGPKYVAPPALVVELFERLRKLDWKEPPYAEVAPLFLRAARRVDDRALDLPVAACRRIAQKLEKTGVEAARIRPLLEYHPLAHGEQAGYFGEALPPGLMLD